MGLDGVITYDIVHYHWWSQPCSQRAKSGPGKHWTNRQYIITPGSNHTSRQCVSRTNRIHIVFILPDMCRLFVFFQDRSHIQTKIYFSFLLCAISVSLWQMIQNNQDKNCLDSHHAASSSPNFLVWASLKLRIIPGFLHSRSQWQRWQIYTKG